MRIRAVLFDLDGTLIDTNDMHVLAWEEAFASIGAHFDRKVIHDQIGKGTDMLVPALLPDLGTTEERRLGAMQSAIFKAKYLDRAKPFPGAQDLLARVHAAGLRIVLASSAAQAEIDHYCDLLGAKSMIDATTSADDVKRTKPAPDIFATALDKVTPLKPEEVLIVGDTPYDVEAGAKCGIATLALRSGKFADQALHEAGALAIYDDVAALLADFDNSPLGSSDTRDELEPARAAEEIVPPNAAAF